MPKVLALSTLTTEPKKKRERIQLIETKPTNEWFVLSKTSRGREVWYLRFEVTGEKPPIVRPVSIEASMFAFPR